MFICGCFESQSLLRLRLPEQPARLGDLYLRVARRQNGFIDRTAWFWQRAVDPPVNQVTTFCVCESGEVTGYVVLGRRWLDDGRPRTEIACREMMSATPAAGRRLWTLLADERSIGRSLVVTGPPAAADQLLFAEQAADIDWQVRWMLRILDVEAALTGRGYPTGREGQVVLDVEDDLVPRNGGRFALEVAGGHARVRRGGGSGGPVLLSVRALAALYTGHLTAEELAAAGVHLPGGDAPRKEGGDGSLFPGIGEDADAVELGFTHEIAELLEGGLGLPGVTDDEGGAQGQTRHLGPGALDQLANQAGAVSAAH